MRSKGWQQAAGIGVRSRRGKEGSSKGGSGAFPRRRGADPACSRARLGLWWAAGGPSGGRQVGLGGHPELAHAGPSGGGRLGPGTLGSERGILAPSFPPRKSCNGGGCHETVLAVLWNEVLASPADAQTSCTTSGGGYNVICPPVAWHRSGHAFQRGQAGRRHATPANYAATQTWLGLGTAPPPLPAPPGSLRGVDVAQFHHAVKHGHRSRCMRPGAALPAGDESRRGQLCR